LRITTVSETRRTTNLGHRKRKAKACLDVGWRANKLDASYQ
jgi:hypothetical protein